MKDAWTKISEGLRLVRWLVVLPSISSLALLLATWVGDVELDKVLALGFLNLTTVILSLQE